MVQVDVICINADRVRNLKPSDYLPDPDAIRTALAAAGRDEGPAERWPTAIRWRAESDKKRLRRFAPVNTGAQGAGRVLAQSPRVGEAPLFPMPTDPSRSIPKATCEYWLQRAEKAAELPHIRGGGWHMFRRAWAQARKHMPVRNVMAAGGRSDPTTLQEAYQSADPDHMLSVVNR